MKSSWKAAMKSLSFHLLDVGAGRERPLGAGDHHDRDLGIGVEPVERLVELGRSAGRSSAFSALGRFRVIRPTGPRLSTRMVSYGHARLLLSSMCPDPSGRTRDGWSPADGGRLDEAAGN